MGGARVVNLDRYRRVVHRLIASGSEPLHLPKRLGLPRVLRPGHNSCASRRASKRHLGSALCRGLPRKLCLVYLQWQLFRTLGEMVS